MNDLIPYMLAVYDCTAPAKSGVRPAWNPAAPNHQGAPAPRDNKAHFLRLYVMAVARWVAALFPWWMLQPVPTSDATATLYPVERMKVAPKSPRSNTMALLRLPTRKSRAAAHRAMAKAALFADSSLSTRLKRYQHHIDIARHLELQEVAK